MAAVDPRYDRVQELRHLSPHSIREMEYFFGIYKDLEGKKSVVTGWRDRGFAEEALDKACKTWADSGWRASLPAAGRAADRPSGPRVPNPAGPVH